MAKKLDPTLLEILTKYGERPEDALWDCHGTWVAYHKAIERIAAKAKVEYDTPVVLVAEKEAAAILVTGKLGDRTEWSIGEAAINLNYRVSGRQAAYPFAMAEKRAKDRVVLKLIGLHGLVYSEEESDDFKPVNAMKEEFAADQPTKSSAALKREDAWPKIMEQFEQDILDCKTLVALEALKASYRAKVQKDGWTAAWKAALADEFAKVEDKIMREMEKEDA